MVEQHGDYIRQETLSVSVRRESPPAGVYEEAHKVNGLEARLGVKREETG